MKIFIACSKHFYVEIKKIAEVLESMGHEVSYPNSYDDPFAEERFKQMSAKEHIKWKAMMMNKDKGNIEPQDAVLILNFEKKGISNYIWGATFLEVYVSWELGKKIFFYNPLPDCSFTDELIAINPIIINGDLSLIK
ncbi:hypothetical protein KAT36_03815 [Candidatus Pacearchaeota archaeon]|nr:hypothetical protein [Candidatus Pacearchaeota archaeon]